MTTSSKHQNARDVSQGTGLSDPTLGLNLSAPSDYGTNSQFLDIMQVMRSWIGHQPGKWGGMETAALVKGGYLDDDGWPTEIPAGLQSIGTVWDWNNQPQNSATNSGTYVLTYEGEGTIRMGGDVRIVSSEPGRIVFENISGATMTMDITATDPNGNGNYIRDISIVAEEHVALHEAGALFDPEWLALIDDARVVRFMDWGATNNATVVDWEDRREAGDLPGLSAGGNGVPVEYMVALANQIGADPWFNIPHTASEEYIRAFATYVRDNLDPSLTARIEYSNEAWNSAFTQQHWLRDQAAKEWGATGPASAASYFTMKATEVATIWNEVFGNQADARLTHVLAVQTANNWLTGEILKADDWKRADPGGWIDPSKVFDEMAVTTYFGGTTISDPKLRAELLDVLSNKRIDAKEWFADKLMDPDYPDSVGNLARGLAAQKAWADKAGLDLVSYEGGQHVHHSFAVNGLTDAEVARLTTFMTEFVRSKEMAELYEEAWEQWEEIGDGVFMQYGDMGVPSKWGSWGLYAGLKDNTPRAEALKELNEQTDPWWTDEDSGTTYQQGLIIQAGDKGEILTGTHKNDFLIGGKGNDIFIAGEGDDGIHGGGGRDRLILSGNPADYTVVAEGRGYRIEGPDGSDFIIDIEEFGFSDGKIYTLDEVLKGQLPTLPVPPDEGSNETPPEEAPPEKPPVEATPQISTRGEVLSANGELFEIAGGDVTGVSVGGVNRWSKLGIELGNGNHYVLHEKGASASFNGQTVAADYFATQENRAGSNGGKLADAALDATKAFGSVLKDAGALVLTDGNDLFMGRNADDFIFGGAGDDTLMGGEGNDTLSGGSGNDYLYGGAGADTFIIGTGRTHIADFTREDTLDLSDFGDPDTLTHGVGPSGLWLSNGTDTLTFAGLGAQDIDWVI